MNRLIKYYLRTWMFALAVTLLGAAATSCSDDIVVGTYDSKDYEVVNGVYCMLRNAEGPNSRALEFRTNELATQYYIELSKASTEGVDITVSIDEKLLTEYNLANNTSYEMFPAELVKLEEDGAVLIAPGQRKSDPIDITLMPGQAVKPATTYVLPLLTEVHTPGLKLSDKMSSNLIFIKSLGALPSTAKPSGIVTIAYVECNSNNPANAGEWTLATSGIPIIDIVHLFAANINWIEERGCVGVKLNPNIQRILDNPETYIRPLQRKGIKVCLTILGNHDGTGVAGLSDEAARAFAAELKSIVDTYGLDGVDFDDEWSEYAKYPLRPGCIKRSGAAYSRLCYETKRAMPDKLCTVYDVGASIPDPSQDSYGFNIPIDGMYPGDFVDYSYFAHYGSLAGTNETFLGMKRSQYGTGSIDIGNSPNFYNFEYLRSNGFGVQAIYDLRAHDAGDWVQTMNQNDTFKHIAKRLYDDPVGAKWSGINHF